MSIEAMKQWLEALVASTGELRLRLIPGDMQIQINEKAITSLRQAIEHAEKQEPIAFVTGTYGGRFTVKPLNPAMVLSLNMALYTTPQPQQAEKQEPVFWYRPCSNGMYEGPLHNAQIEEVRKQSGDWIPLVPATTPQPQQAEKQEPVNWSVYNSGAEVASGLTFSEAWDYLTPERLAREWCAVCVVDQSNMPTTPQPQREWVGLTDKDMEALVEQARKVPAEVPCPDYNERLLTLANNKLREKNGAST